MEDIRYFAATGKVVKDQASTPKTKPKEPALDSHSPRVVLNTRG